MDPKSLKEKALIYHETPTPGKISVTPTKLLTNQFDLSLAYSPGVAFACEAIVEDLNNVSRYTARSNLVGVITNGTSVLGLGNIGPYAAKPVMEGKACLFKKFAGIDVFDIELNESDPDKLIDAIAMLEPTLGGINLEDIKAPECFYIEKKLSERLNIPVFHDDQHGTAIIASAALINGLKVVGKHIENIKLVCSGAGAAAIACLDLMVSLGLNKKNIIVIDSQGVIHDQRKQLEKNKARYAICTQHRCLKEAMHNADVFLGCSSAGVLTPDMLKTMASQPLIFALANPEPEIRPEIAKAARPDCIIATGRSDYPNQVNNVLCFPFVFRGALDVGATKITDAMKLATVKALAELAHQSNHDEETAKVYEGEPLEFGPDYIIPKPFDTRLITTIAPAVAQAAIDSNVATHALDINAYRIALNTSAHRSAMVMRPVFISAKERFEKIVPRLVFAEGEDERVLRAAQFLVLERIAKPIIIGRPAIIEMRLKKIGAQLIPHCDFELVNPEEDLRYQRCWQAYHRIGARLGITPEVAKAKLRQDHTLIGALLIHLGDADGMICGTMGTYQQHLKIVELILPKTPGSLYYSAMNLLMLPGRNLFICDTYVNEQPNVAQLVEMAHLAATEIERFGIIPKIALLSHSNFGSVTSESTLRMKQARAILAQQHPHLEIDGEMHGDSALSEFIRKIAFPQSPLKGEANLLIMPNLDAANIAYNLLKTISADGLTVGPFLLGCAYPVHILTYAATVRRIINMAAVAAVNIKRAGVGDRLK